MDVDPQVPTQPRAHTGGRGSFRGGRGGRGGFQDIMRPGAVRSTSASNRSAPYTTQPALQRMLWAGGEGGGSYRPASSSPLWAVRGLSGRGPSRARATPSSHSILATPAPHFLTQPTYNPQRPGGTFNPAYTHTPAAAPAGKWSHDLFASGSDLYNPQIDPRAIAALTGKPMPPSSTPSASLRPFGALTPAAVPLLVATSGPTPIPVPTGPRADGANGGGLARFGILGAKGEAAKKAAREQAERERRAALQLEQKRRQQAEEARKVAMAQKVIAEKESEGFVVQVEGLVFGTSAEDVQTAFGAYGETSYCFIVNEATATEDDELVARLVFERKKDAEQACLKLKFVVLLPSTLSSTNSIFHLRSGAIADGKPLRVAISPSTP
ncbi:hypothetical protein P7C70_g1910, partial [Phenoliferia sp. Uapishka_3]